MKHCPLALMSAPLPALFGLGADCCTRSMPGQHNICLLVFSNVQRLDIAGSPSATVPALLHRNEIQAATVKLGQRRE
jgi:hypothetical protein